MEKKIIIDGMSCSKCVSYVKKALAEIEGVLSVAVNLEGKKAALSKSQEMK